MFAPVLVTPPISAPVTLQEAKAHLRVTHDDDDTEIYSMIEAATGYLDGMTGILGRAIMPQVWRESFGGFGCKLRLSLAPVASIVSLTYLDTDGNEQTVPAAQYELAQLAIGPEVLLRAAFSWPGVSYDQSGPVRVTYTAGYPSRETVPQNLKRAILLHVGTMYEYRETLAEKAQPTYAYEALVAPFRRSL